MNIDSIVIVSLLSPSERFFGRLLAITPSGVTVRGIDLNAFDDWVANTTDDEENGIRPTTVFFPLHRVEKIILDEGIGAVLSFSDTFSARVGRTVSEYLG